MQPLATACIRVTPRQLLEGTAPGEGGQTKGLTVVANSARHLFSREHGRPGHGVLQQAAISSVVHHALRQQALVAGLSGEDLQAALLVLGLSAARMLRDASHLPCVHRFCAFLPRQQRQAAKADTMPAFSIDPIAKVECKQVSAPICACLHMLCMQDRRHGAGGAHERQHRIVPHAH